MSRDGGAWVLAERRERAVGILKDDLHVAPQGPEREVCTSDFVDVLDRLSARRRSQDPSLTHRTYPNTPGATHANNSTPDPDG